MLVEAVGSVPAAVDTRPVVVADVVGIAFAGPLYVIRMFDN